MELKDLNKKRQKKWKETDLYKVKEDTTKPKFYILDMFPYPSGSALHVGHPKGYIATDALARKKMLEGFNVLHPMGFDTFGLGTEQYAIDHKMKPQDVSKENIAKFIQQLENFGTTYDRSRAVNTADPKYFKWTQRVFLQMYNHYYDEKLKKAMPITDPSKQQRLAYVDYKPINRCPKCMTGLANEDLDDGKCERCGSEVEQKPMKQRVLRITKYAERLLEGLNTLQRDESMKDLERNWIGKSEGTEFDMQVISKPGKMVLLHGRDNHEKPDRPAQNVRHRLLWLKTETEKMGFEVYNPLIPKDREAPYEDRKKEIEKLPIDEDTTLIGHSAGGAYFVRWLGETKKKIKKLILISPSKFTSGENVPERKTEFFNFDIDKDISKRVADGIFIFISNDENRHIKASEVYQKGLQAKLIHLSDRGHFTSKESPKNEEFPEVLDLLTPKFSVYTTRIDTVFGMSFVAIAPEHPLVDKIATSECTAEVEKYKEAAKHKTQLERTELQKDKTGVFCGAYAINPFNGEKVPVFVADYVLANYGTGVVMAVPAHDERDFEFAKKYNIKITTSIVGKNENYLDKDIVEPTTPQLRINTKETESISNYLKETYDGKIVILPTPKEKLILRGKLELLLEIQKKYEGNISVRTEKGRLINSGEFTGLESDEAIKKMQAWLQEKGIGGVKVNYKMQDRVFSRQRYRGEPFPIAWTEDGEIVALDESVLPLELPDVENYEPTGTEEGPLANITDRVNITLPDGRKAKRETNTMPGRAGSSRYRLRYMDVNNDKALVGKDKEAYRGNVDVYVGGAEHVTRHMIYGRFRQKFLHDIGVVSKEEPFESYHYVGLIMGEDGRKMSKRRGNVVNPDDIITEFGTDVLRTYEMFMGPFDQSIAWSTNGIKGVKKFLDKIILLKDKIGNKEQGAGSKEPETGNLKPDTLTIVNQTIKKVGEDLDGFRFNTAISQLMILVNHLTECPTITKNTFETLVILVAPFAPHLAEELREQLGNEYSLFTKATWPKYDETCLVADTVTIGVQVNGKVRGTLSISKEAEEKEVMQLAKSDEKIKTRITGEPKKVIYVKGKILNIVV